MRRHALSLAGMPLSPLAVWRATPWIRPFRGSWLLRTYLVPLTLLLILFDGLVSCLRTYSPGELRQWTDTVPGGETYDGEIGVAPARTGPLTYLIGVPRHAGE